MRTATGCPLDDNERDDVVVVQRGDSTAGPVGQRHSRVNNGDFRRQQLDLGLAGRQGSLLKARASWDACRLSDGFPIVPTQTRDVHEFGILIEQRGERVGVAVVPRTCEPYRDVFRR